MDKIIQRKNLYSVIIAGIALGILAFFSPGSLFFIVLTTITVFFINCIPDKKERNFILKLFLIGFVARIFFCFLITGCAIFSRYILNYASIGGPDYSAACILDDSAYYTLRGQLTSMYWMGKPMSQNIIVDIVANTYGLNGYVYILASFFTLFGYSPTSSRFINCFLGTLTAILIYFLVKEIFGVKPAKVSSILIAFFPSLMLWSITNLKETSFIFAIYFIFWAAVKFKKTKKIYYVILILLSLRFLTFIRSSYPESAYLMSALVLLYFFYLLMSNLFKRKKMIIVSVVFIIGVIFVSFQKNRIKSFFEFNKTRALIQHRGGISEGGKTYKLLSVEELAQASLSNRQFSKMLVNGWLHFFLEPFPWRIESMSMLLSLPQMFIWYLLLIFSALGMAMSVRYKLKESLLLIMFFFVITSALAVTGGNIGTIFRFRDIITPTVLIFASLGLVKTFNSLNLQTTGRASEVK